MLLLRLLNCLLLFASAAALIHREKFFSQATGYEKPKLSPDGELVGCIGTDSNKVKNVFVWNTTSGLKEQVTFENRNVKDFFWTGVESIIIFETDQNGDENEMVFKQNISEVSDIGRTTIFEKAGIKAFVSEINEKDFFVYIAINDDTPKFFNVYKFDLLTNELTRIFINNRFDNVFTDHNMQIRMVLEKHNGATVYFRVSPNANQSNLTSDSDQWEEYVRVSPEDASLTRRIAFDNTNENMYWIWGENSDLGDLVLASLSNFSQREIIYKAERSVIHSTIFHPEDCSLLGLTEYYHKPELVVLDNTIENDVEFLKNLRPNGALNVKSTTGDMETWLVEYLYSDRPTEVFLYQRGPQAVKFLFSLNQALEGYTLSKQIGFDFMARDGLIIQAYLSLPPHAQLKHEVDVSEEDQPFAQLGMIPVKPQKMVLLLHGGPRKRDLFGLDKYNAFLTNRGYAVLQVNFRGSIGFGKTFANAGNGEWSRKMHTDLLDAVDFVIAKGIANRSEVAIMGGSFGGYAALVGLTFTPDTFACGVDIAGPSNLVSLMDKVPPYWTDRHLHIQMMGGDSATESGRQELLARSPLFHAGKVKKPLLIIQGANDPRVKQHEAEQLVEALKKHSIPNTYVLYPDEGHGIRRHPNSLALFGHLEKFLHECLGGDYQPFTNGQYNESAIVQVNERSTNDQNRDQDESTLLKHYLYFHRLFSLLYIPS